ncbi:TlpA family protein disulfide reductase [Niabella drilacis]|uniref:Thiol-disulfide isomerase or thioredoxin n=1 Tax=Niabella drilacis (strain DSM 25811 / CCM 8410 / CCUG 62505 / LMG 26954 / E90) TaxID=1285928 RepID=A0A1G7AZH6_NIADE|nr:TlpA disulfide reductase family protein [Niabella drilacis]SDE20193.1 Thiol-disulfide isomerase or thioredoxin [Niabella drilacis]
MEKQLYTNSFNVVINKKNYWCGLLTGLSLLFNLCSCSTTPSESEKETIQKKQIIIHSNLKKGQAAFFYYFGEFDNTVPPFSFTNTDSLKVIESNTPVLLIDAVMHNLFLVYPGDTLHLYLGDNKSPVLETESDTIRNNELSFFVAAQATGDPIIESSLFFSLPNTKAIATGNNIDFTAYIQTSLDTYQKRLDFLKSYQTGKQLSPSFVEQVESLYKNFQRLQATTAIHMKNLKITDYPGSYIQYLDSLIKKATSTEKLTIGNQMFLRSPVFAYYTKKFAGENLFADLFEYLRSNPVKIKEQQRFLEFVVLKRNLKTQYALHKEYYDKFINDDKDKYSNYLLNEIDALLALKSTNGQQVLIDLKGNRITWNEILKKHKDSLLYIDFWASWCMPCRRAFPSSKNLVLEMKDKPVKFIYISTDAEINAWKKAAAEENLPVDASYLIPDFDSALLKRVFNIQTIPRYILLGKNGEVIDDDAEHPGSPEIKTILEQYF